MQKVSEAKDKIEANNKAQADTESEITKEQTALQQVRCFVSLDPPASSCIHVLENGGMRANREQRQEYGTAQSSGC